VNTLGGGTHTIIAVYSGDTTGSNPNGTTFASSTGTLSTFTVNKARTTTTVTTSAASVLQGVGVTFMATVANANTTTNSTLPTGTVTFTDSVTGQALPGGTNVQLNGGVATLSNVTTLSVGNHTITATYNPGLDANFTAVGSTSGTVQQTITSAVQSLGISSSNPGFTLTPNPSTGPNMTIAAGSALNLTITLLSGGNPPTVIPVSGETAVLQLTKITQLGDTLTGPLTAQITNGVAVFNQTRTTQAGIYTLKLTVPGANPVSLIIKVV